MASLQPFLAAPIAAALGLQIVAGVRLGPLPGYRATLVGLGLLLLAWSCLRQMETAPSLPLRFLIAMMSAALFWLGVLETWLSFTTPLALGLLCLCAGFMIHGLFIFILLGSDSRHPDRGGLPAKIGLLVAVTALFAVAIEAGFRLVVPADVYEIVPDRAGEVCLVLGDDGILRATPGFRGRFIHPEFPDVRVEINADGFRDGLDESVAVRDGRATVLLLGDSLAFGTGVELPETFHELLEQESDAIVESGLRIHCAAMPGDGQLQQLDRLNEWAPRLQPDAVIVALYEGNDLHNNVQAGGRRHGILPRGEKDVVSRHRPDPPGPALLRYLNGVLRPPFWRGSSSTVQYLLPTIQSRLAGLGWVDRTVPLTRLLGLMLRREQDPLVKVASWYTLDLLTQIQERCRELGAALVVTLIPAAVQADPSLFDTFLSRTPEGRREELDRTAFHLRLVRSLKEKGFIVVDSLGALEEAARAGASPFYDEGHLNRRGHAILSELLAPVLRELLRKPS